LRQEKFPQLCRPYDGSSKTPLTASTLITTKPDHAGQGRPPGSRDYSARVLTGRPAGRDFRALNRKDVPVRTKTGKPGQSLFDKTTIPRALMADPVSTVLAQAGGGFQFHMTGPGAWASEWCHTLLATNEHSTAPPPPGQRLPQIRQGLRRARIANRSMISGGICPPRPTRYNRSSINNINKNAQAGCGDSFRNTRRNDIAFFAV